MAVRSRGRGGGNPHRRRVVLAVALVQAMAAVGSCAAISAGPRKAVSPSRASAAEPPRPAGTLVPAPAPAPTPAPSLAAVAAPVEPPRPTGVGSVLVDLSDPTRPTVAGGRVLATSRHLPTIVRYPAVGPRGSDEVTGARPAGGPYPLVVFAHGYDVTPDTYAHLLHSWAAAGFVVAAPFFPLEAAGGPLDETDLVHEPADISAVITAVLNLSARPGPMAHLIDPRRIAVAGHSDGAVAALGAAFGPGDARIRPVIAMSGASAPGIPHPDPRHPLLVVQGTDDNINDPSNSYQVYLAAGRPRILLELFGAGHLPPIADATPWRPIVESVTTVFLRHYFGEGPTIGRLASDGTHAGLSRISGEA